MLIPLTKARCMMEGAIKLKFVPVCHYFRPQTPHWKVLRSWNLCHSAPLQTPFHMVSLLAKVKIFRFWPKTMDYNKAFLPKSRYFSVLLLLHSGRCYEAEICAILFLLRYPFIWYPFWPMSKFQIFWPKTMDYNKAFLPKSRYFSVVLLLHSGRCYEAEICAILFLLRCPFIWFPFWPKTMDYNKAF